MAAQTPIAVAIAFNYCLHTCGSPLVCTKPISEWVDCKASCEESGFHPSLSGREPLVKRLFGVVVEGISNPILLVAVASAAGLLAGIFSFDDF